MLLPLKGVGLLFTIVLSMLDCMYLKPSLTWACCGCEFSTKGFFSSLFSVRLSFFGEPYLTVLRHFVTIRM